MTPCRCSHGRGVHRRAQGVKRLPCQALFRGPDRRLHACKCRDYHPAEVKVKP